MTDTVKMGKEELAVVMRVVGREVFVEGGESSFGVVSLDAAPVIEGFHGDAGDILALRIECHGRGELLMSTSSNPYPGYPPGPSSPVRVWRGTSRPVTRLSHGTPRACVTNPVHA